ncbi:MAG TPA: hypothetical protein VNJ51_08090 [Candidatus Dormibacteraeota bacterium]|nr:hypothetical protein [Candidatus Dormibacteraeota bacterium]
MKRVYVSCGEASGEVQAALLLERLARIVPDLAVAGIGGERLRAAGVRLRRDNRGWASLGPISALAKIPKLLAIMWLETLAIVRDPVDLVLLVDFGAFNLRLAQSLRRLGYRGAIAYYFPPSAWLDRPQTAREVARTTTPIIPFQHQRDFYRSLGLDAAYFGHPLASVIEELPARPVPPPDGGTVALLPGSRSQELGFHVPRLIAATALLRESRPRLRAIFAAHDDAAARRLSAEAAQHDIEVLVGARAALCQADVAIVASGTAVLEAALLGVPSVALYVLSEAQARIARRVYHGRFVTPPNLVAHEEILPELLQEEATPERLAAAAAPLLESEAAQRMREGYRRMRARLGTPETLDRIASFVAEMMA